MFERGFEFAPGYRLESFLGRGQFGQVWRSTAPGGTLQAVKFIDLNDGQWEKEYAGIQRVKQIRHPNLMPILAIWLLGSDGKALRESLTDNTLSGESTSSAETTELALPATDEDWLAKHSGRLQARWMVVSMLLGGKNLQQRLEECIAEGASGIPPKELLTLMDEAAKGLDYLNSSRDPHLGSGALQHCDVKPANIVLVGSSAVVCDFGLARIMARDQVTASSICGTPAYMAPETISGKPSRNSDQYSLAITYYQLRTGTLPLSDGTLWQMLDAHRTGKLNFDGVSDAEQEVLRRATALQWDQRFPSNGEMIEALRESLRSIHGGVSKPTPTPFRYRWAAVAVAACATVATFVLRDGASSVDNQPEFQGARGALAEGGLSEAIDTAIVEAIPELLPERVREVLEAALADTDTTATQFSPWLDHHAGLKDPLAIPLLGHQRDLQQVFWAPGQAHDSSDPAAGLITQADDPYLMQFNLQGLGELLLNALKKRLGAVDAAALPTLESGPSGQRFLEHSRFVAAVALSPDWQWAASGGSADGRVLVWSANEAKPNVRATLRLESRDITSILWHPTRSYMLVADGESGVHVVQTDPQWPEGAELKIISFLLPRAVEQWAFDHRGETLTVLDVDQQLYTFSWKDCERLLLGGKPPQPQRLSTPGSNVRRFAIVASETGEPHVIAAGEEGEISFYTLAGNNLVDRVDVIAQGPITCFDAAGKSGNAMVMTGGELGQLTLFRGESKQTVLLPGHRDTVTDVKFSPDGQWAASVSRDGMGTLRRVDQNPERFVEFRDPVSSYLTLVSWHPSGRWLITGGHDGHLLLWDARHLRLLVACCPSTETSNPTPPPNQPAAPAAPLAAQVTQAF